MRRFLLRVLGWGYLVAIAGSVICLIASAVTEDYSHSRLYLEVLVSSFFAAPVTVLADVWLSKQNWKTKWETTHHVTTGFGAMETMFRYLLREGVEDFKKHRQKS